MGLPNPKPEEPAQLDHLGDAELLQIVREAPSTEKGKAAHDALLARIAVKDLAEQMREASEQARRTKFAAVRPLGRETIVAEAAAMRADWGQHLVNYIAGEKRYVTRAELIRETKAYCFYRQYSGGSKGNKAGTIKTSTIKRWLTLELEGEIRTLAMKKP